MLTDIGGHRNVLLADRQDIETDQGNFIHRLTRASQLLDFRGVFSHPSSNALDGPAETLAGFDRHEPVDDLRRTCEDVNPMISLFSIRSRSFLQAEPYLGCAVR